MTEIQPVDLTKKTVFVLGAGASKPFGLPLGTELKSIMIKNLSSFNCQDALIKNGFKKPLVDDFIEALPRTYYPTIDIFLENKKKFREVGSYVIAFSLIPLEDSILLFPHRDWYAHLYGVINFVTEKPNVDNIVFVTLNYDRSLEHFLYKNIEYNCPEPQIEHANKKLGNLKIIHAHGSIGPYPLVRYGGDPNDLDLLHNAAERIRITSDKLEDSVDFLNAQTAISEADNIVFLGFGYDPTTLQLLIKGMDVKKKRVLGTAYQITSEKQKDITNFFKGSIELTSEGKSIDNFVNMYLPL